MVVRNLLQTEMTRVGEGILELVESCRILGANTGDASVASQRAWGRRAVTCAAPAAQLIFNRIDLDNRKATDISAGNIEVLDIRRIIFFFLKENMIVLLYCTIFYTTRTVRSVL